jgi:hypothetical protein
MTDEQALILYVAMEEEFGDMLPNFEHHPIQFAYYVKLFKLINQVKQRGPI